MLRIPWRLDPHRFSDVRRIWEHNRCVGPGTISLYRYWICRITKLKRLSQDLQFRAVSRKFENFRIRLLDAAIREGRHGDRESPIDPLRPAVRGSFMESNLKA
jgi:hypothetical protein